MRDIIFFTLSLVVAFMLMVWLPQASPTIYSPPWVFLVLSYWVIKKPHIIGLSIVFLVSLFMDVMTGALMGVHALAMIVPMFVLLIVRPARLNALYQLLLMFLLVLVYQVVLVCVHGFMGVSPASYQYWLSPISAAVVWAVMVMPFKGSHR